MEECQHHEEQEYENDDPSPDLLHDATKDTRLMEQVENGEKDKDSCDSSILKNGEYEVRSMVEFSNNNLIPTYHIFQHPKDFNIQTILDCSIKKCVMIKRKKNFTSPIVLLLTILNST